MSGFCDEKGASHQSGMPQHPAPTATSGHSNEFLPKYEEAVNANMRNFGQVEGQDSVGASNIQTPAKEKMPLWKRSLFLILPLLLVITSVVVAVWTLIPHGNVQQTTADPVTLLSSATLTHLSSVTLTKRQTVTITSTQTFTAPIAPSIAASISSFYASWSASIVSLNSEAEAQVSAYLTVSPSTTPLPTINMSPSSSARVSTTTAFETPISAAPTTLSTVSRSGPTGANLCGLPGSFCMGGKRDVHHDEDSQEVENITTIWKYLTLTTTITSTKTKPPFPASVMDAYNSYIQGTPESVLSGTSGFTGSVLSSFPAPISTAADLPATATCVTQTTGAATVAVC